MFLVQANEEQVSGCCFNQVKSGPGTDLQLVERAVVHMGFIMGLEENQSGTIVFPLPQLTWNNFLSLCLTHTRRHTELHMLRQMIQICLLWRRKKSWSFLSLLRIPNTGLSQYDISEDRILLTLPDNKVQVKLSIYVAK